MEISDASEQLAVWQESPLDFVLEAIGAKPSNQQSDALRWIGKLATAKIKASNSLPLSDEEKWLSSLIGLAIRSGQGLGKDTLLSWVYIWLLVCFPCPKGLVTAPVGSQLNGILWPEVRSWLRRSKLELWRVLDVQKGRIFNLASKGESFVEARTANVKGTVEEQAETLSGTHARYMINAVDEASGVPAAVFKPLEGSMTGEMNFAIVIGNPTRQSGYFFDIFHTDRAHWLTKHWNAEESDLDEVTGSNALKSSIERNRSKYDRNSNFYRTRVLGDFPIAEPDVLIPIDWIEAAVNRDIAQLEGAPIVFGVDVAYRGDDKSVIAPRQLNIIKPLRKFTKLDTWELSGWVAIGMEEDNPKAVCIDTIGYGAGVFDNLRHMGKYNVWSVNVSEKASDDARFFRKRDELYWRVRDRFEEGTISIPDDEELKGELSILKWKPEVSGGATKVKVEGKQELRARNVASPNCAEAVMLSFFIQDDIFGQPKKDPYEAAEERERLRARNKRSWMRA